MRPEFNLEVARRIEEKKRILREKFNQFSAWSLYVLLSPWRLFKVLCFSVGFGVIMLFSVLLLYTWGLYSSLPEVQEASFRHLRRIAVQNVHERMKDKKNTKRFHWTELRDVSRDFLYAVIMSEDSTFFEHQGVNFEAVIEATFRNYKKGSYAYGASTISQQVTKNIFLTREKTLSRKIKELILTKQLEERFTKNQILEIYLNIAEWGPDLYGVRSAAQHYFGKNPAEINAAEGALLAILLPSPRRFYYSVFQNKYVSRSKKKKIRRILGDMLYHEFISPAQYRKYVAYEYFSEQSRGLAGKKRNP